MLALYISDHPAQDDPESPGAPGRPFELPCLGVTLPQVDPLVSGLSNESLAHPIVESGVGGEADLFLLNSSVDIHAPDLHPPDQVEAQPRPDRFAKQLLGTGLTHPPPPATHAGGVYGRAVFEVAHAREVLPIRVFNPGQDHLFVTEIKGVLQVVQGNHQARADAGPAPVAVGRSDPKSPSLGSVEPVPVDLISKPDHWLIGTDQAGEFNRLRLPLVFTSAAGRGFHASFCRLFPASGPNPAIQTPSLVIGNASPTAIACFFGIDYIPYRGVSPRALAARSEPHTPLNIVHICEFAALEYARLHGDLHPRD